MRQSSHRPSVSYWRLLNFIREAMSLLSNRRKYFFAWTQFRWFPAGHFSLIENSKHTAYSNIDWFDIKVTTHIRFYDHFWPFLWHMYGHLSQNWDSDGHFEVLNGSESWVLKIWRLIFIWASKTEFDKTTLKRRIFKDEKICFFTNMAL